jgi:tyrosinase
MSENNDSKPQSHRDAKKLVSGPLRFDIEKIGDKFYRVDLQFHGLDHSGPSYEGRIFINNPEADQNTPKTLENGYVGSYHIFGHGRCFGDVGHCEVRKAISPFDYRPSHPLTPAFKRIKITDQIRKIGKNTKELIITIVPILSGIPEDPSKDVVKLERISIVSYNK